MVQPFNMASAVVELNKQSDSSFAPKPSRQQVPMDLVPVKDPSTEKHNEVKAKCNHFTIRGYVSEVRKKDPSLCYPFPVKDPTNPPYHELPPMEVPEFRWWKCGGCVPEAGVSFPTGNEEAKKPDKNMDKSLAIVEENLKVNFPRERNEVSASTDSNDNRYGRMLNVDPKGKGKARVGFDLEPALPSVRNNGFLKDSTKAFLHQITNRREVGPLAGNQVIELGSKCNENGVSKVLQKDRREYQIETGLAQESENQISQERLQACPNDRLTDSQTNIVRSEVVRIANGPINDCKTRLLTLPDLNECSGEPLYEENNEAMINISNKNDVDCEDDDDDYLGAECRKNPKVRLLSELLGLTETQIPSKGRKRNLSLTNSIDENGKRKRVGSQEEGSKSTDMRVSDSGIKKLSQTTGSNTESDSEYATDSDAMSTEIISKALAKRRCKSRVPLLEKKNKKTKFDNGASSSYRQKNASKFTAQEKGKTSENMPPKSNVHDKLIERSLVMTKKRGKLFQTGKEGSSLNPCKSRVPKDFSTTQKDENSEKRSNQKFQKASDNDSHFYRSLVDCRAFVDPEDGPGPSIASSQAGPMIIDGTNETNHQKIRNEGGETSIAFRTTEIATTSKSDSFDRNGERISDPKTNMKDKKPGILEIEKGSPLALDTHVQASSSVANQKEQTKEIRRRIHDIDINSIPIDDKVTDDIPMDIVELMAKNQYERHLSDPKETPLYGPRPDIPRKYIGNNGINDPYEKHRSILGQPPFLTMPRPPPSNPDPRNSMVHGNLSYFPDFNRNSLNVASCHSRENTISSRYLPPNQVQDHNSAAYGLTLSNWNGTMNIPAPQRYPPNYINSVEPYRVHACGPRHNSTEPSHVWPSHVVASRLPLGMNKPQLVPPSSSVLSKVKIGQRQSSSSILTFSTPGQTSLGKQQNLNFSESSVDMCSNDAVSAMHLLSLMQNAARMQKAATLSLGPTQKVVGPTSSRQGFIEEKGRSSSVQENARHPCYPTAIPTARPFVGSYQNDGGNVGGFSSHIPLTLRGQRNMERSHFGLPGGPHRPQRRYMGPPLDNGKDMSVISPSSSFQPLQGVMDAVPNFFSARGVRRDERTISPLPEKMVCKLNQNPSEFNDIKELSRYMIGPDDLRPRKTARVKSARPKGDSNRQEGIRINKHNLPGKEREKQRIL